MLTPMRLTVRPLARGEVEVEAKDQNLVLSMHDKLSQARLVAPLLAPDAMPEKPSQMKFRAPTLAPNANKPARLGKPTRRLHEARTRQILRKPQLGQAGGGCNLEVLTRKAKITRSTYEAE